MHDITVKVANGTFNYRVGAIIIDDGNILMVRNSGESFYYTVGGRIQFGESAQEAVLREVFEETKIAFVIERLAYIHENFFVMDSNGEPYHEVALFFLMKPIPQIREKLQASFKEDYGDVDLHWLPIDGLADLPLYPEFFKTELQSLSNTTGSVKYFVTREGKTTDYNL